MWKPYIIYKTYNYLMTMIYWFIQILVQQFLIKIYNRQVKYVNIVENSEKGILAFRNPFTESHWTKGDVFKRFNCLDNEVIYNTRQFTANRIIIKKNLHSMTLFKIWWETAKNYSHLFDDSTSITKNFNNFTENRHDQSVFSLICKTNGVEEEFDWESIPIKTTRIRK